jgi:hypothetical protein
MILYIANQYENAICETGVQSYGTENEITS